MYREGSLVEYVRQDGHISVGRIKSIDDIYVTARIHDIIINDIQKVAQMDIIREMTPTEILWDYGVDVFDTS